MTVSCRACCVEARGPVSCRVPRGWRKGRVRRSAGGLPPAEGVGAAWRGRACGRGSRVPVLTGSPGHCIVSGREGQGRVGCRGGWLEGRVCRSAGGLPPAEEGGCRLAGPGVRLGPRDRPQYSPDRRVIVSCRGARASVVSVPRGAGSRAVFAARPVGFRRPRRVGAAWRGRGFALGRRDRPQYSPDRRVIVSYVSRVTEGFALGPRRDRPRGPRPPLGRWASAGRGGMGAAWRGRGFALGPRDRPQYSPDRRVIVSCRGARASVVSGAAGAGSRATFAARPVGFRRTRGAGCRLAEWGGWTVTWIVELGTLAGAADERRGGRRRLRDAVGPGAAARGDDLVVADEEAAQRLLHGGEH